MDRILRVNYLETEFLRALKLCLPEGSQGHCDTCMNFMECRQAEIQLEIIYSWGGEIPVALFVTRMSEDTVMFVYWHKTQYTS